MTAHTAAHWPITAHYIRCTVHVGDFKKPTKTSHPKLRNDRSVVPTQAESKTGQTSHYVERHGVLATHDDRRSLRRRRRCSCGCLVCAATDARRGAALFYTGAGTMRGA